MGLSSTLIYTSELILCSTICVPSATRRNIHMYPYFLFAAIHHLRSSPTFSVRVLECLSYPGKVKILQPQEAFSGRPWGGRGLSMGALLRAF